MESNNDYHNKQRPQFNDLPLEKSHPPFSAWGLFGKEDELGTLNLLTPEVRLAAKTEIITGKTFSLKYVIETL